MSLLFIIYLANQFDIPSILLYINVYLLKYNRKQIFIKLDCQKTDTLISEKKKTAGNSCITALTQVDYFQ